jgi:hypothetical protein
MLGWVDGWALGISDGSAVSASRLSRLIALSFSNLSFMSKEPNKYFSKAWRCAFWTPYTLTSPNSSCSYFSGFALSCWESLHKDDSKLGVFHFFSCARDPLSCCFLLLLKSKMEKLENKTRKDSALKTTALTMLLRLCTWIPTAISCVFWIYPKR